MFHTLVALFITLAMSCATAQTLPIAEFSAPTTETAVGLEWSELTAPTYYSVIGPAEFKNIPAEGEIVYSELDDLGRTHSVSANISQQMIQERIGVRIPFEEGCDPSGWGNNEEVDIVCPDNTVYHGYFWNRSHLLANALGGDAERHNLITGTRMQNVGSNDEGIPGGMSYIETKLRYWFYDHPEGTALFEATPLYYQDELIPRAIEVNVLTSDAFINEHVIVYNACKGYEIDYASGQFHKTA